MPKINRVAETLIRQLISAGSTYQQEIFDTIKIYRNKMNQVQLNAEQRYAVKHKTSSDPSVMRELQKQEQEEERVIGRYKKEYIEGKSVPIKAEAKNKIRKAQDAFQAAAKETAKTLRHQLEESILDPINSGFIRLAETLQTFGVAPSRLELDALLTLSEGNLTAIRCLDSLIKKTDAPFTMEYKAPEDYIRDLELIESLGTDDYFCSPTELHPEMCDIFDGEKVSRDEDSVSFKMGQTFGNTELLIQGASFNLAMESLEKMIPSWGSDIHYSATKVLSDEMEKEERVAAALEGREPDLPEYEPSVKITEGDDGLALAKELGQRTAEANRPIADSLGKMVK